jgi:hypothetical protein
LYRLIVSIEAILDDARQAEDEKQQMELLLDTKKLTEIFMRELDSLIKQKMGIEVVDGE